MRINIRTILILVIFAFAFVTRLYNLQEKAIMHDECMFTYYSWHLSEKWDYMYQPILHGPVLQEMNALMFLVFGDSTYTMRLFATLCGLAIFFVLVGFRSRFGREGLVAVLALFALSSFFMFYARFCRNDMPFALFSILTFYLYWKFFREGRGLTLVFAILSSMMLICIKENQLIYFFTIYTFAVLLFIVDALKGYWQQRKSQKGKKKLPVRKILEKRVVIRPLPLLALVGGIFFYFLGYHAKYYEFKALGFFGIVLYFALMFRRYYKEVKEEDPDQVNVHPYSPITIFINTIVFCFFCRILYVDLFSGLAQVSWGVKLILALFIFTFAVFYLLDKGIRKGVGEDRLLRRFFLQLGGCYWYIVIGLCASYILYIILFSTWFKHPEPAFSFYKKTLAYWAGQHKEHRIKGEFHFYLPLIAIYNLPALLIVLGGTLASLWKEKIFRRGFLQVYVILFILLFYYFSVSPISKASWKEIDKAIHMSSYFHFFLFFSVMYFGMLLTVVYLWRKQRFNALLVYWSMGAFLGYSYAGEKVPWVTVHIMLPLLMLAAVYIQKLWKSAFFKKTAVAWYILFALFALWNVKSSMVVSFVNHSNIAERMIYSHGSEDVPRCAEEVKRIAFQLGTKEKTRILVKGWAVWPMRWYLRDYDWTEWEKPETTTFPMVIMNADEARKIENLTENYHIAEYTVIQWWVAKKLDFNYLFNIWKVLIPKQYTKGRAAGTDIKNSKEEWKKIWDYMMHRETYEPHDHKWGSISAPQMAFCVRKDILHR